MLVAIFATAVFRCSPSSADEIVLEIPSEKAIGTVVSSPIPRPVGFGGWREWSKNSRVQRAVGSVSVPADHFVGLELAGKAVEDLSFLEKLPADRIEWIEISRASLGPAQLRSLASQTSLKQLSLNSCELSQEALGELEGALPELESLSLSGGADGIQNHSQFTTWIANLPKLSRLHCNPPLDLAAINTLAGHPRLEYLNVQLDEDTEKQLAALAQLPKLSRLGVRTTEALDPDSVAGFGNLKLQEVRWFGGTVDGALLIALSEMGTLTKLEIFIFQPDAGFFDGLERLITLEQLQLRPLEESEVFFETSELQDVLLQLPQLREWPAMSYLDGEAIKALRDRPIERLEIDSADLTADDLSHLGDLTSLRTLALEFLPFDDEAIAQLANLPKLETLKLWSTGATGRDFGTLSGLQSLREITIYAKPGTNPDLSTLAKLPALESLIVGGFHVDPEILEPLEYCEELRNLQAIIGVHINDGVAELLGKKPKLTSLTLGDQCLLTDRGAKALTALHALRSLSVTGAISAEQVAALASMPSMQRLSVETGSISSDEETELKDSFDELPLLRIRTPRDITFGSDGIVRRGSKETRGALDSIEGQPAPPIEGKDRLSDDVVSLEDFRGKVVLVHFWGNWCMPCLALIPNLEKLQQQYQSQGLEILGVHTQQDAEKLPEFLGENPMSWPSVVDSSKTIVEAYAVRGYPSYYLIDRKGVLRAAKVHRSGLESAVQILLDE